LQILPPKNTYDLTFGRGYDVWEFIVQGFVTLQSDIGSQRLLDELCASSGPTSVKAALETDPTLGGVCEKLQVISQSPGRQVNTADGSSMLLVEWTVTVWARGAS
jgi:hypothetical protein